MTNKYKISDLAKDFNMSSKEAIAIITEITGSEKKASATLNEHEIGLFFNKITKDNSVKSFKEYFATGDEAREKAKKAREEEKNKKLLEQMAILEQLKAAAAAANGEKAPEPKKEPEKKVKKEEPAKAEPKKETVKKAEQPKKETQKTEDKAQKTPEVKKEHKPSNPQPFVSKKKDKAPGEAPKRGPAEIRHIDTRTSNVNIDKYNEKYETIAPANSMKDNYSRKQKINQKSQKNRQHMSKKESEAEKLAEGVVSYNSEVEFYVMDFEEEIFSINSLVKLSNLRDGNERFIFSSPENRLCVEITVPFSSRASAFSSPLL